MKQELSTVWPDSTARDQQIAQLTRELGSLRTEQAR